MKLKPALTYREQIQKLNKDHNLKIDNEEFAE